MRQTPSCTRASHPLDLDWHCEFRSRWIRQSQLPRHSCRSGHGYVVTGTFGIGAMFNIRRLIRRARKQSEDGGQTDAEKIAVILNDAYRDLRAEMQLFIESGAMPRYTDRNWLHDTAQNASIIPKDVIYYKDNKSAFDSACQFMDTSIKELKIIPALVEKTAPTSDGLQMCQFNLASADGGTPVLFCTTIDNHVPRLYAGELAAFQIAAINPEWGRVGFIVAKLDPAISATRGWKVSRASSAPGRLLVGSITFAALLIFR
jgi:hypothetical protein